jgi:hypothetical protein
MHKSDVMARRIRFLHHTIAESIRGRLGIRWTHVLANPRRRRRPDIFLSFFPFQWMGESKQQTTHVRGLGDCFILDSTVRDRSIINWMDVKF